MKAKSGSVQPAAELAVGIPGSVTMEMEKSHYVVSFKPGYRDLLKSSSMESAGPLGGDEALLNPVVVTLTQGGFGQDIIDDERQVKERFLEYLFSFNGIDLERSADTFDSYFELQPVDEFIDLDEEI